MIPPNRRIRILPIDFDLLMDLLTGRCAIDSGLPADAQFINAQPIQVFRMLEISVWSETFDELRTGEQIPRLRPLLRKEG